MMIYMSSYKIVSADRVEGNDPTLLCRNLEEKVELLMGQGWSCVGGVVMIEQEGCIYLMYQTMIKLPA